MSLKICAEKFGVLVSEKFLIENIFKRFQFFFVSSFSLDIFLTLCENLVYR